ncbi:DUF6802 family protein [Gordonia lacunae]|uniref:DUF6802 domain-containing protein n=1 Tax=Gordonia lacunae TaxID=417102 RepID=A0A243QEJ5_9ACTN|nr:DUF6802 family protein [Gordonia lacunae]OUC80177.1 hypothetical protein CA982_05335 [Gordonia lacunae]
MDPMFSDDTPEPDRPGESALFDEVGAAADPRSFESVAALHESPVSDDLDDHLWMHDDGRIWDLGPAEVDTDDDGINDSLTRNGPDGFTVYTDSDRDGQVDKITEIGADGEFRSAVLDPDTGEWISGGSGRIG